MDEAQARVQQAVNSMWNTLDKDCLRKMQIDMYTCSANCCKNYDHNIEQVQNCIEGCSTKLNNTQTYIGNELQQFQDRLQRCVMSCQDEIRDKVSSDTPEKELIKHKESLEKCVVKCANNHVDLLPNLIKKMKDSIKKS